MAQREDEKDDGLSADDKLQRVLESRWDPTKLSTLMRSQQATRGQKLDMSQRSRFEGRLGVDLGDVRIFTGELAEEIVRAHNAEALTIGNTGMILMGSSTQYAPGSALGTSLLAHELTHVAQSRPNAIARKAVTAELAQEDESEEEAEEHEEEVLREELGLPPEEPNHAEESDKEEQRKAQLLARVLELYEEDIRIAQVRMGAFGYDPEG